MNNLTISIVSHGHRDHLRKLLEDLNAIAAESRLHVLLTLNIPEPEPQIQDYPNLCLTLIRNKKPQGFGANHNMAFHSCTTRWFAILNPDLRLPANPFPTLIVCAQKLPVAGVVAPKIINSAGAEEDHVRPNLSPASLWRRFLGQREPVDTSVPAIRPRPFYWLAGMFMLFDADAYREVGGFDERYFLYCEDYDICARLFDAGYGVHLVPEVFAIHDAQRDSHGSLKHLRWHISSLVKVWCTRVFWRCCFYSSESIFRIRSEL